MMNMLDDLHKNGFIVVKNFYSKEFELNKLADEVKSLFALHTQNFDPFANGCMNNITENDRSTAFAGLRYLPSLLQLCTKEKNIELCKSLGLAEPGIMPSYNLRMDLPDRPEFLFQWHQDTSYLLGSLNALTFWVPLTTVNETNGTIEIIPGSHLDGIKPVKYIGTDKLDNKKILSPKDICLENNPEDDLSIETLCIEAEPGDLVIFSQLLLHRSTPNHTQKIRWCAQFRYADLSEQQFIKNNYPMGNTTNIYNTDYMENS